MKICELNDSACYFYNPYKKNCICEFNPMDSGEGLVCTNCEEKVFVKDGTIDFVPEEVLDSEKKRELEGNLEHQISELLLPGYLKKDYEDRFSHYIMHFRKKTLLLMLRLIKNLRANEVAFLGCGYGSEIGQIIQNGLQIRRILASDLSLIITSHVLKSLEKCEIDCDLIQFSSDLDYCPIKKKEIPIVINEALHHTSDIHRTIEGFLAYGYNDIIFSEPMGNLIIGFLEKIGMAQRVEYSGVKPGRIEAKYLKRMSKKHGYTCRITTFWIFPEDYFKKIQEKIPFTNNSAFENIFLYTIDLITIIGRPFNFGNFVVCQLKKQ